MSFEGRLRKDAKELSGTFAQGPIETPLNLEEALMTGSNFSRPNGDCLFLAIHVPRRCGA